MFKSCRSHFVISTAPENECQLGTHNCHEFAKCIDTRFSFECKCKPGFIGHGFEATPDMNYEQRKVVTCYPEYHVTTTPRTMTTTTTAATITTTTTTTAATTTTTTKTTTTTLTTTTTRKFDEASDLSLAFLLKEAESFAVVEDFVDTVNNEKITESFEVKGPSEKLII